MSRAYRRLRRLHTAGRTVPWPDRLVSRLAAMAAARPRLATAVATGSVGVPMYLWQGPVAAGLTCGYGAVAVAARRRLRRDRRRDADRRRCRDAINLLAADLRAGVAPRTALAATRAAFPVDSGDTGCRVIGDRLTVAWTVAESSGAPAAEVCDRLAADLRSQDRAQRLVDTQTAGTRATAWLLAALPFAGLALGHGLGGDPVGMLLHSPLGAVCAATAALLQLCGLLWTQRLTRVDVWAAGRSSGVRPISTGDPAPRRGMPTESAEAGWA